MSLPTTHIEEAPLDLSKWRKLPTILIVVGGLGSLIGAFSQGTRLQFGYSWLQAFMFCLSFTMGGLFLVMAHHLFDASWSIPIRRINEHLACLAPVMALLFIPIAILAKQIYPWMTSNPAEDHALAAKLPAFTMPVFYAVSAFCLLSWIAISFGLRNASLRQDVTGGAAPTHRMRAISAIGIFVFALTFTLAAILWMKALMHEWFSTMYGVWYFAASTWLTLITVHVIALLLKRLGPLREVMLTKQFYFLGSVFFAFTVFYAYVTFAQYFIIWNANMPEETFWYVLREKGSWWDISMLIIFGHFFVPFLALLRIDAKLTPWLMIFLAIWAWIMHFCDMSFNIMPVFHKDGFVLHWLDLATLAFMVGVLAKVFLKYYAAHPPYPMRDPRMAENVGVYSPPGPTSPSFISQSGAH
jgi:hypothetical protein